MSSDGPSLTLGPAQYYVLLGNSLSLVCGTGLDSNPPATITWTAPSGDIIANNARYDLKNGPDSVRLNISNMSFMDAGVWTCDIHVMSEHYVVNNGHLIMEKSTVVGTRIENAIHVTVISE